DEDDPEVEIEAEITAVEAKRFEKPELNDELAEELGLSDLDALKADVRESLTKQKERQVEAIVREQLVRDLLAKHSFDLPEMLVKQNARAQQRQKMMQWIRMGLPVEQVQAFADQVSPLDFEGSRDALRRMFV